MDEDKPIVREFVEAIRGAGPIPGLGLTGSTRCKASVVADVVCADLALVYEIFRKAPPKFRLDILSGREMDDLVHGGRRYKGIYLPVGFRGPRGDRIGDRIALHDGLALDVFSIGIHECAERELDYPPQHHVQKVFGVPYKDFRRVLPMGWVDGWLHDIALCVQIVVVERLEATSDFGGALRRATLKMLRLNGRSDCELVQRYVAKPRAFEQHLEEWLAG